MKVLGEVGSALRMQGNHDWDLQVEMQPQTWGGGLWGNPRSNTSPSLSSQAEPWIPRAHAYTWQMMAWAMNKRNYMNTSVQEPLLTTPSEASTWPKVSNQSTALHSPWQQAGCGP